MRTIMGFCGICRDITDFTKGLTQAAPHGHGENRIVDVGCGLLGYHRHASGEHPAQELQPLTLDGSYAVCSGELIGYGMSADASHITEPDPTGESPARSMRMAMDVRPRRSSSA